MPAGVALHLPIFKLDARAGTAGWNSPKRHTPAFPDAGSHLERYARVLPAVEINSSFYRPHRPATYARWAASVPSGFRFSVRVPRAIPHERRLVDAAEPLARFLDEVAALGPLLVQLPPSFRYDKVVAEGLLGFLRDRFVAMWRASRARELVHRHRGGVPICFSHCPRDGRSAGGAMRRRAGWLGGPRLYLAAWLAGDIPIGLSA